MKTLTLTLGVLLGTTSLAAAGEGLAGEGPAIPPALVDPNPSSFLAEEVSDEFILPAPRAGNLLQDPGEPRFWLGLRAGYLRQKDAEKGVWFGGVQGRLFLAEWVALEGSITFHQSDFLDGDVEVTQYPVQVTGLFFPLPDWEIRPYGLFGAGWYYTRTTYHGALSAFDTESDHTFGFHIGVGAEFEVNPGIRVNADIRYIFIDEPGVDNSQLEDEEWDLWQVTLAGNISF